MVEVIAGLDGKINFLVTVSRARLSIGMVRSSRPHVRLEYGASGIAWQEHGARRRILAANPKEAGMQATKRLLEKTLSAFASGAEVPASGDVGLLGLEVLAACYRSAATGARVRLDAASRLSLADHPIGR